MGGASRSDGGVNLMPEPLGGFWGIGHWGIREEGCITGIIDGTPEEDTIKVMPLFQPKLSTDIAGLDYVSTSPLRT